MTTDGPRCGRCGSDRLRRSHSRSGLQKLVRRHSGWDRYACQACGHRGWSWGKVLRRVEPAGGGTPVSPAVALRATLAGRRLERRDLRLRRRVRLRSYATVAVALGLGVLAAVFLQRCGGPVHGVE